MPYESKRMQRLSTLFGAIEARKKNERSAPTYKDAPALREIAQIVREQLMATEQNDVATYDDTVIILRFLAESYDALGRYSISAYYYNKLLELSSNMKILHGVEYPETPHDFYNAIRVRNAYVDDDAEDLAQIVAPLLPPEKIKERLVLVKARRRSLRFDPVETTKEYLAVIDAVEENVERARTKYGPGSCIEVWGLKQKYLAEYGIAWRTPIELNPRTNFEFYE